MIEALRNQAVEHRVMPALRELGNCVVAAEDKFRCINLVLMRRVIDALKETIADVSSVSPSSELIGSFMASITLINTQLIHQFVEDRCFAETRSPE